LKPRSSRTVVVGAGGGGVAAALLRAVKGEAVTLLEAHSAIGGCASWFRRGPFTFDAGATTVSGVGVGEPLGQFFELLGRAPTLYPSDPGIVFHLSSGKVLRYHRDFEAWLGELAANFPGLPHRRFWELTRALNRKAWELLRDVRTFPFTRPADLTDVLRHPRHVALVPYLLLSTEAALKAHGLDHPDYLELVNGILLISAQATSEHIPLIVGAMALSYPAETYAPVGGMKGFMDFFEGELRRRGVDLRKRTRVESFGAGVVTLAGGETLAADKIIVNLPVWNMARMATGRLREELRLDAEAHPGAWSAFAMYFGVAGAVPELYHQVHLNHPLVKNYFVSFSIPGDPGRAPAGHQTVSISTHVYAAEVIDKDEYSRVILEDFRKRFGVGEVRFLTSGSPRAFERFTGRERGFVGGLPFLYGSNPLSLLGSVTGDASVFRVGDTVFPGQGICGVVAGALQLDHRLK
jgi:phytoene dehydrogenase-like protein